MVSNTQQKVIVIVGPTASGKSDLAVHISKKFGGEVISADSRQVYKGLNIGTGKITTREMNGVLHYLLDVCSPKKVFSAHDFVVRGKKILQLIKAKNKIPIIAGGTGFYIDALLGRVALGDAPANVALRKKLEQKTTPQLLALLKRKNRTRYDDIAEKNEQNNRVRLIRAIELSSMTSVRKTSSTSVSSSSPGLDCQGPGLTICPLWIGIMLPDEVLKKNIRTRLLARMKRGMLSEARHLHAQGVSYKRMHELGLEYRYLALLLQNKITKEEMIEQLSTKIWQYARRQKTYWRKNKDIVWFVPGKTKKVEQRIQMFLKQKAGVSRA